MLESTHSAAPARALRLPTRVHAARTLLPSLAERITASGWTWSGRDGNYTARARQRRCRAVVTAAVAAATVAGTAGGCSGHPLVMHAAAVTDVTAASGGRAAGVSLVVEPGDREKRIYELLAGAKTSIDMTMYELADPTAQRLLAAAQHRGVRVRVILDRDYHGKEVNAAAYTALHRADVDVQWAPPTVLTHQKTIVVDGTVAAVGTGNLDATYSATAIDFWLLDPDPTRVAAIESTFDADLVASGSADTTRPTAGTSAPGLVWSPGSADTMVGLIDSASHTVEFTSEELSSPRIVGALAAVGRRGVACRIVMTDSDSWARAFAQLQAAGCQVHTFPDTDGAPYMHAKAVLVDGDRILLGSQNASAASLNRNRELSETLDASASPTVIAQVAATFDHDFDAAPGWTQS